MTEGDTVESESSADQPKTTGEKATRDNLGGKTAIVTGASAGIGLSVAKKLAEAGANVVLVARGREKLDAAAASIGLERAMSFAADVSHFDSLRELLRVTRERFGRIDILVNNAGLNHRGPAVGISPDTLGAIITTNLTAPVFLSRLVAEHMVQQGSGSIVNVASLAGKIPVKDEAAYSASKAGLRAFGRALAMELDPLGVHVSTVCPGPVDTDFLGDLEHVPDIVLSQPMVTTDDVADAVLTCISSGKREVSLPALSGLLTTLGYVFPSLAAAMHPLFERRGAANRRRYVAARAAGRVV
ncbi:SDR family NAD(P)-dependent oxidoreductase [Pendulispora brunnea]|uniref:SDR family NAD(P)-dependent oxidoreductase n=1 Tax=Pendulispora brunnea TaxID=2905690 RepID=A0ABZ2KLU1_9BACT